MKKETTSSRASRRLEGDSGGSALRNCSGERSEKLCTVGSRKLGLMDSRFPGSISGYPPDRLISETCTSANFLIMVKSIINKGAA